MRLEKIELLDRFVCMFDTRREQVEMQELISSYLDKDWDRFLENAEYIVERRKEMEGVLKNEVCSD